MIVLSILGTRPEAIKMAPILRELNRRGPGVRSLACLTGQHRELIEPVLDLFDIQPDYQLATMRPGQSLAPDLYFAPTPGARENLLREGCAPQHIHVTGNTSVDALLEIAARPFAWESSPWAALGPRAPLVLVTAHRRENFGEPLQNICAAIGDLARHYRPAGMQFIFPVHLNPEVGPAVSAALTGLSNV